MTYKYMPHKVVVSSTTKELYDIIAPLCDNGFPVWHFTTNRFQTITFEKKSQRCYKQENNYGSCVKIHS